jgi:glucose-6-phosphate isomerase
MQSEQTSLGDHARTVMEAVDTLREHDIPARIWARDHTAWRNDPTEISNRLGWLTVNEQMRQQVPYLQDFAAEIRALGMEHVVLLAMGGSALAPEVYRATFGSALGFPTFTMLDSIVPGWVRAVAGQIDPAKTLFITASKSGGTVEVLCLYRYFRALVEASVGSDRAGGHFAAITDQGSDLEKLAHQESFRRVFLNPADVGGRFSGLSLFGLVPAALMGVDLDRFLESVEAMRQRCTRSVSLTDNPAAWVGTVMGSLAKHGVDKLTLVTSPSLASFGLWMEQMIAESLGKDGTGIIPIAGEPLVGPEAYGRDRLFVYLRLDGDENAETDAHMTTLQNAGHPTMRLEQEDHYALGGELFRGAFATAVAGHILGVHPFDQPNVQRAKDIAIEGLQAYLRDGRLPAIQVDDSVEALLAQVKPGDYFSLLLYLPQSAELDFAVHQLRRFVQERYHIATTAGYGPRYLHSTGQLHKGGPNSGLFLQLEGENPTDVAIPSQPYTFGVLANAQAQGDIRALQGAGRRVVRRRLLSTNPARELQALTSALTKSTAGPRG